MHAVAVSGGVSDVRIEDVKLLGQRGVHMKTTRGRGGYASLSRESSASGLESAVDICG